MKNIRSLTIFLFIAAIIPALGLILIKGCPMSLGGHDADFHYMAIGLLNGNGFYSSATVAGVIKLPNARHPLYPLFVASSYFFTNNNPVAIRIMQILIHGLTCLIIYSISKKLFRDDLIAFASAFAWAIYPLPISLTIHLYSEILFTFLLSVSALFLLETQENPNLKNNFFSGIFLGFTILTNSIILSFIPVLFLWLISNCKNRLMQELKFFLIVVSSLLLVISPWLVRNYIVHKAPLPIATGGSLSFYGYNNEKALEMIDTPLRFIYPLTEEQKKELSTLSERDINKYFYNLGWQFIKAHPKIFFKRAAIELNRFWHLWPTSPKKFTEYYLQQKKTGVPNLFLDSFLGRFKTSWFLYFCKIAFHLPYNILFLGMFISIVNSFKRDKELWRRSLLLALLIVSVNLVYIFHHGSDRYRLPIDPYVFILGFHGVMVFYNNLKNGREK